MNETFEVATSMACNQFSPSLIISRPDPLLRANYLGCAVFDLLLEMYKFNVTYVNLTFPNGTKNNDADVFVVPRTLSLQTLEALYPVSPIINRRYGFILRRPQNNIVITRFYSVPFRRSVWNVLYAMCVFISLMFYFLIRWERKVVGRKYVGEADYGYQLLVAIGAFCQRVPHIKSKLWSRRIIYLVFFTFCYLIHCYYTSNLLSRLVNDRDSEMHLDTLANSDYQFAVLDSMVFDSDSIAIAKQNPYFEKILKRFSNVVKLDVTDSLKAILSGKVALFSDYITMYPYIRKNFDDDGICSLIYVDMYSNIKKYIFTSKHFPYIEQFKVGQLRLKETGLLKRLKSDDSFTQPPCSNPPHVVPSLGLVAYPFILLASSFFTSSIVLAAEILHYRLRKPPLPFIH